MSQGRGPRRNMFNCHYLWLPLLYCLSKQKAWLEKLWLNTEVKKTTKKNMIARWSVLDDYPRAPGRRSTPISQPERQEKVVRSALFFTLFVYVVYVENSF